MEQLREDIDPMVLNTLTETDLAIWATPVGVTFVDGDHPFRWLLCR
jgi:hypothetical protein